MMMIIIGNSLARAFGIAGAAGIVRFRTPVDDPKDVTILFLLMGLGMATGLGAFAVAGLGDGVSLHRAALLDSLATQRTRLMSVEMSAAGRLFPTAHVEAVLVRNEVVFEPREISQGKSDITVKYHTWLDPRASLDDLSAQLMAEGGGRRVGLVGSGEAGEEVVSRPARRRSRGDFTSRTMKRTSPSRIRPSSSRASASIAAGSSFSGGCRRAAGRSPALLRERQRQLRVLAPGAHGVEQPAVADERVHDQDDRHEAQHVIEQTGAQRRQRRRRCRGRLPSSEVEGDGRAWIMRRTFLCTIVSADRIPAISWNRAGCPTRRMS